MRELQRATMGERHTTANWPISSRSKAKSRRRLSAQLQAHHLAPGKGPISNSARRKDLAAYDLYLQAKELVDSYTQRARIQKPGS